MKYTILVCLVLVAVANAMSIGEEHQGIKLKADPIEIIKLMSKSDAAERVVCGCCGVTISCKNNVLEPEFFLQPAGEQSLVQESRITCGCCGWTIQC